MDSRWMEGHLKLMDGASKEVVVVVEASTSQLRGRDEMRCNPSTVLEWGEGPEGAATTGTADGGRFQAH